ncbi:thiol-disulfide isomerase/thioredoxin [Mucilaginibacter gracilis]|uniref:Thiol-disulfide isomerase/thioredoxin n=1 Tax=Mucilaginibacter gracilis TaxID=423350 RepID=A0A495IVC3_9SPHI|nr:TlpA disulfide reductase family protein [Mucilaginibacter gracilis]RKR79964.1 thiol-disulfide isomerase/thioredoxin [Mucilaginibacter gracilis]
MTRSIYIICLLVLGFGRVQAQVLDIKPDKPQRGTPVTITYHTDAPGAKISKDAAAVTIVFTYSTFYELPWKMPMTKKGDDWVATFVPQRYATFATFTLQSGDIVEKPADKHFSIPVYDGAKRVKSGLLHESYSLSAQMPKAPDLQALKQKLQEQELENYPNNYEAKVALLQTKIVRAKTAAEKLKYRTEARKIIAAKLEENPTFGGNINLVTMGYLMIGEKTRVDSVREVIMKRFPDADVSIDRRASIIAKDKDSVGRTAKLEALLKKGEKPGEEGSTSIHDMLFEHYASVHDSVKALRHAAKLVVKANPYTPETLKDIAAKLTEYKVAPAAAINYAQRSLKIADQWPVGIIRYFPEYGYIPSFVADSTRAQAVADAKCTLVSIIALNNLYQGNQKAALNYAAQAMAYAYSREGLLNVASVYQQTNNNQKAFDALWKLLLKNPTDTVVLKIAKTNFLKFNNSNTEFAAKVDELKALEIAQLTRKLKKELMNKPHPELSGLVDLEGKAVTPEMLKGKIVIIDFWATWCVPCMQELPYLHNVYQKYKNNPNVMFMVVNSGANNTLTDAQNWAKKNQQYTFPIYYNKDKDIGEKVGFTVIPTIAVLDQNGSLQYRTIGFEGEILEKKLSVEIDILLQEKKI